MDNQQFIDTLERNTGLPRQEAERLVAALANVMALAGSRLESVSIPGFGTFEAVMHAEKTTVDLSTGATMLMPPRISLEFRASSALRKSVKGGER